MRTKVNVAVVQGEVEEMEMGVIVLAEEVLVVIEEPLVMNPNARFVWSNWLTMPWLHLVGIYFVVLVWNGSSSPQRIRH